MCCQNSIQMNKEMASPSSPPAATETTAEEQNREEEEVPATVKEIVHKTKLIEFLGRTTPIILQNDNGPCPLLAICNVLSLRNCLNLSPDVTEVSQEKLLSLVAERLIDSNTETKDVEYVKNQQQNISDAIDLLPRLTTGIDVNLKFRRIDDFEFTPECAIFDLLDIPLYHGWIVDPQDLEAAEAIGSKSYNTLMGELVALDETQNMKSEHRKTPEDDSVDFAAATTAALGVPSPSLLRGRSFDGSPVSVSEPHTAKREDAEEEAELMKALKLSKAEFVNPSEDGIITMGEANAILSPKESTCRDSSEPVVLAEASEGKIVDRNEETSEHEPSIINDSRDLSNKNNDEGRSELALEEAVCSSGKLNLENLPVQSASAESRVLIENPDFNSKVKAESTLSDSRQDPSGASLSTGHTFSSDEVWSQSTTNAEAHNLENKHDSADTLDTSRLAPVAESNSYGDRPRDSDATEALTSKIDNSEPIYEGEECILDPGTTTDQNREPVYEGEVVLSEEASKGITAADTNLKCEMTINQGDMIREFLDNSASQLTIYGLFCLRDGIKERELCIFFRNNHFNTMFKFEGELYILVTDQGYINQPDLVWEKLNEVNGDTIFMTGNFKEFKLDNHTSPTWSQQNAIASTTDYLSSVDISSQDHSSFNSDLQLAIALQQQELEQQQSQRNNNSQQQSHHNNNSQQQNMIGASRLVTGPQVRRNSVQNSSSSSKQDAKSSKEKCTVM